MRQKDLDFISGAFLDYEIPKEKQYLLKYFTTDLQVAFLKYYLHTGEWQNFTDHTGYYCGERIKYKLTDRFAKLTSAYSKAKSTLSEESMATVLRLESGEYPY